MTGGVFLEDDEAGDGRTLESRFFSPLTPFDGLLESEIGKKTKKYDGTS